MAKRYRPVNRDQPYLFPPSMRDWLPPGHPVWLVITAVEDHLDTSACHAGRKTGGAGAAGYDPVVLVLVLVWAYAHQVTSSRRIGQLCHADVAFGVICGGTTFIQGSNTQNVTSEDGLIIATELTQDTAGTPWYEPMLRQAEAAAAFITA